MSEGQEAFRRKEYFEAFKKFFKTVSIDPTNEKAQRFQVLACEYVAVAKLQEKIASNEATETEKADAIADGIEAAEKALRTKRGGDLNTAKRKLQKGLLLNPGNQALTDLLTKVRAKIRDNVRWDETKEKKSRAEQMRPLLSSGERNLNSGRYANAITDYQRALDIELTPYNNKTRLNIDLATEAEEGLERAKSQRRTAARRHYSDAAKYFNSSDSGDLRKARDFLKKALAVDKDYTAASTKLRQVMGTLRSRAKEEYDKGMNMVKFSQYERARLHFQKVLSLLDDPSESLYRRSSAELDAMGPG